MSTLNLRQALARRHETYLRRAAAIAPPGLDSRRPRRLRILLLWLLISGMCAFLDHTGGWGFGWLEGYFYDSANATLADLRPPQKATNIVIVNVSDNTFASDNPLKIPGPPPPRIYQAKLLRFLTDAGAKAVAFDFLFDTPRPGDDVFVHELERAKMHNTVVILACLRDKQNRLLLPIPLLREHAKLGHIMVQPALDRPTIERVRAFIPGDNDQEIPAMSLQMALVGRDQTNWRLPKGQRGGFAIRYTGSDPFPFVPFEELVAPDTDREFYARLFKGKYVFIGDTTLIGNDIKDTPLGAMPGVEVHAHALNTLLSQRFLFAAPSWLLVAVIALLALPIALLHDARHMRTLLLVVLELEFGYVLLFVWLFAEMDFTLHLVGPLAALFLMLIAVLFERGLHEERERSRMFDALVLAASSAIETRDPATSGHSRRVTCMTVELAIAVSCSGEKKFHRLRFSRLQIKELCYSALLHDFGKIGVREAVLLKSHKLEPLHFQVVQNRLLTLQSARREDAMKRQIELLHTAPDDPQTAEKIEALVAQTAAEIEALEDDRKLLSRANDPQVTFLPDEEYSRLEELLTRLASQTYCDENGEQKPLLSPEERIALQIRKGSLTDDEFKQIQAHAQMSYDFLKQVKWTRDLENLAHIAWGHHEKLSGKGYPRGVSAPDIPMPTRMMTIADIFDALTAADRPYKKAMPLDRALKILHEEVDFNSLDADLLKVFVDEKIYESLTDGRAEKLLPTLFQ